MMYISTMNKEIKMDNILERMAWRKREIEIYEEQLFEMEVWGLGTNERIAEMKERIRRIRQMSLPLLAHGLYLIYNTNNNE